MARYIGCMGTFATILMGIAMAVTLGVLFTGLVVMARGGEVNRKHGNRLMRMRVIAQGMAIAMFAIAVLISRGG